MRFKHYFIALSLSLVLALSATTTKAAVVKDLYSAKVIVPDQSQTAWDKSLPQALTQVLIKLTGNPNIAKNPMVKQAFPKVKLWVKSYGYHEQWQGDQSQLWLRFDFDMAPVNRLLQQANQTKWSNDRPLTLMWLELNQPGESKPQLVDGQNSLKKVVEQNSDRRGLPILFPAVDLEDQPHLAQSLNNPANWEWAFTHYEVKAVLAGQLKLVDQQWQAQWLIVAAHDSKQWEAKAADLNELMANGVDEATNWMAQQLLVGNDPHAKIQKMNLQVADVQDLGDYAKISDYLSQLSLIHHVSLGGVNNSGMSFELQVAGTQDQLIKALSNSTELVPDETDHSQSKNTLYYRWAQATKTDPVLNRTQEISQ